MVIRVDRLKFGQVDHQDQCVAFRAEFALSTLLHLAALSAVQVASLVDVQAAAIAVQLRAGCQRVGVVLGLGQRWMARANAAVHRL